MRRLIVLIVTAAGIAAYRRRRLERSERELGLRDGPGNGAPDPPPTVRA